MDIYTFASYFSNAGFELYLVGGALRNMVAGLKPTDYDFATSASPNQVISLFKRVIPTGLKHGTVTVLYKSHQFEVTTYRLEGEYSNSRHPDSIEFTPDIYEDLKRRDFTINAMAFNLSTKKLIDPHKGQIDLKNKKIRAIGIPRERFSEDGLRLMRACRFAAQLNFSIEDSTLEGMRLSSDFISNVSAERIMEELVKILGTIEPSRSFNIMRKTKLLEHVFPELYACIGVEQKGYHSFEVFDHCIYSCDGAPQDNLEVRLAALLHDIGKPQVKKIGSDGIPTFHAHEKISSEIAASFLRRLKFPKKTEQNVCHLISRHMFNYTEEWTDSAVRRFISKTGIEYIDGLLLLRYADQYGQTRKPHFYDTCKEFKLRINELSNADAAFSIKDLKINGKDLMKNLNIPSGPQLGVLLNELLETFLDDPKQNNKTVLMKIAEKLFHEIKKLKE